MLLIFDVQWISQRCDHKTMPVKVNKAVFIHVLVPQHLPVPIISSLVSVPSWSRLFYVTLFSTKITRHPPHHPTPYPPRAVLSLGAIWMSPPSPSNVPSRGEGSSAIDSPGHSWQWQHPKHQRQCLGRSVKFEETFAKVFLPLLREEGYCNGFVFGIFLLCLESCRMGFMIYIYI